MTAQAFDSFIFGMLISELNGLVILALSSAAYSVVVRSLVFVSFTLLLDLYTFQAIKQVLAGKRYGRWLKPAYWGSSILLYTTILLGVVLQGNRYMPSSLWFQFNMGWASLGLAFKAVVCIILFAEDLRRAVRWLLRKVLPGTKAIQATADNSSAYTTVATESSQQPSGIPRRKFVSQLALATAAIPLLASVDGIARGRYNFQIHRPTLWYPDLPASFDGMRLLQLSDLHLGSFHSRTDVLRGLKMALDEKVDLICFTGDMVNDRAEEMKPWAEELSRFRAPMGQFTILGNHDYGDYVRWNEEGEKTENFRRVLGIQQDIGLRMLRNEHVLLERNGEHIALMGVENWGTMHFTQYGRLEAALAGVPAGTFRLLLSHDPHHWDYVASKHALAPHLTLSGHTHGFQFGIEYGPLKLSPVQLSYPHWAGLYNDGHGRHLYVNRGFGYNAFPGRVGILPEITVITLRRGSHA